jgi:glutathione S-transferase
MRLMSQRMRLYNNMFSGNCYKVRLLFAQLEIEYERREVDVTDRSWRRDLLGELNPALRVPVLVLDDGRALAESGANMFHFAQGTDYLPDDQFERAQVLQWLFFEQYSLAYNIGLPRFYAMAGIETPEAEMEVLRKGGVFPGWPPSRVTSRSRTEAGGAGRRSGKFCLQTSQVDGTVRHKA